MPSAKTTIIRDPVTGTSVQLTPSSDWVHHAENHIFSPVATNIPFPVGHITEVAFIWKSLTQVQVSR